MGSLPSMFTALFVPLHFNLERRLSIDQLRSREGDPSRFKSPARRGATFAEVAGRPVQAAPALVRKQGSMQLLADELSIVRVVQ
jgi:hypothetical protein